MVSRGPSSVVAGARTGAISPGRSPAALAPVRLEELALCRLRDVARIMTAPDAREFFAFRHSLTEGALLAWYHRYLLRRADGIELLYFIDCDSIAVGLAGLHRPRARAETRVGYLYFYVEAGSRGRGLGRAAVRRLRERAESKLGSGCLRASTERSNTPSRRALEASGFVEASWSPGDASGEPPAPPDLLWYQYPVPAGRSTVEASPMALERIPGGLATGSSAPDTRETYPRRRMANVNGRPG